MGALVNIRLVGGINILGPQTKIARRPQPADTCSTWGHLVIATDQPTVILGVLLLPQAGLGRLGQRLAALRAEIRARSILGTTVAAGFRIPFHGPFLSIHPPQCRWSAWMCASDRPCQRKTA
jgi:hypothetical protein